MAKMNRISMSVGKELFRNNAACSLLCTFDSSPHGKVAGDLILKVRNLVLLDISAS